MRTYWKTNKLLAKITETIAHQLALWAWTELVHKNAAVKRETLQFDCIWFLILHWVDALGLFLVGLITKQKGFGSFEAESQTIILREKKTTIIADNHDENNRIVILSICQPCVWLFECFKTICLLNLFMDDFIMQFW